VSSVQLVRTVRDAVFMVSREGLREAFGLDRRRHAPGQDRSSGVHLLANTG